MTTAVYKRGDKDDPMINRIQEALFTYGLLSMDDLVGTFGPKTERAVIAYQRQQGLVADGIVGESTLRAMDLIDTDAELVYQPLTEQDIQMAADDLYVDSALVRAFSEVESAGRGFHPDGTLKVLFERHIFRRQMLKRGLTLLEHLVSEHRPDLCNSIPGGYAVGTHENRRHESAMTIHRECALESASYGRFQLMGFNYESCGYNSAEAMWIAMVTGGEAVQLTALVKFIKAQPKLLAAMRQKDFLQMALIYNGPKQQGYDTKLREAYNRYKELEL